MFKILVVDAEKNNREIIRDFLENEGPYEVFLAENGDKALKIFKSNSIGMVFIDVQIPGPDGVETFYRMKKIKPEIKTVILTDLKDEHVFDRALSVSKLTDGFMTKPFNLTELRECFEDVLSGERHKEFHLTALQTKSLNKFFAGEAGRISKALSDILEKKIKIVSSSLNVIPLSRILKVMEKTELSSASLAAQFKGGINGMVVFMVSCEGGLALIDHFKRVSQGTTSIFDDEEESVLKSLGTILSGVFLKIFSDKVNLPAHINSPELSFEHHNYLIKTFSEEINRSLKTEEKYRFTIEVELKISEPDITFWLSLIPDTDSLKLILRGLGVLK